MTILEALNRLVWRLSPDPEKGYKNFKPNDNDVNALNRIIQHVNDSRDTTVRNNQIFAKMFIWCYSWMLDHYGEELRDGTKVSASVFDDIPQKELNKQLDRPISEYYSRFLDKLNDREMFILKQEIEERQRVDPKALEKLSKEERQIITGKAWELETVTENLNSMIAEAAIKFR